MKTQILSTIFITLILFSTQALPQSDSTFIKSDTTLANTFFSKAEELYKKAQYDSSINYFEKASIIYEKVGTQTDAPKAWEKYIIGIKGIGEVLNELGKYNNAIEQLSKALEIGLNKVSENHILISSIYNLIGKIYFSKGDNDYSLEYYQKALNIMEQTSSKNHINVAYIYNNIGIVYHNNLNYDKALEYYNKSLALKLKLLGQYDTKVANTYNNIGCIYWGPGDCGTGEYDKALEYFKKSLDIRLKILGDHHPYVARNYFNMANVLEETGDYNKALEYYNKSLSIYNQVFGENHKSVAKTYLFMGLVYKCKKDFDTALYYLNKSLTIFLKVLGKKNEWIFRSYAELGLIYFRKEDFNKAQQSYDKALAIGLELWGEDHAFYPEMYLRYGKLYYVQNNVDQALSYLQRAIIVFLPEFSDTNIYSNPSLEKIIFDAVLLDVLEAKADAFEKFYSIKSNDIKDIEMSFLTYQLATELIDQTRNSFQTEGSKLLLGERTAKLFDKAIQTSLKLHEITQNNEYQKQAFLLVEKAKSSILLASLQDSRAKQFAGIPDSLLEQEKDLRIDLAYYEIQIQQERQKKDHQDSLKLREFEAKRFEMNTKYEKLMTKIETDYPKYYDLKYQTQTASIPELQQTLDAQSALIEYFIGDSSIFIITVSNDDFDIHTIPKDTAFHVLAESLNESIKQVDSQAYVPMCHQLYNLLIKPIAPQIATKEKLVIIPHGILYKIPFEALIPEIPTSTDRLDLAQVDYLISRYDISYHYSATLYLNSLQQAREYAAESQLADEEFIGFAPVFSDEVKNGYILADNSPTIEVIRSASDVRSITLDGKWFNELLYSKQEVEKILDLFKRRGAVGYFNTDASEENFKQNAKHYKYIHVATHGMINEANPPLSGIIFSQPTDSVYTDDGILYSGETYHLDLNADLVVLSSCESGIGKLVAGEGLMALTRGFLYAGASTLVVSLWKVSDVSTAQLMTEFYRNLKQGMSKAAALRAAKLHLLKQSFETEGIKFSFAHPFFWASFVLIGEPESQMTSKSAYRFLVYVLMIIFMVLLVGYLIKRQLRIKN